MWQEHFIEYLLIVVRLVAVNSKGNKILTNKSAKNTTKHFQRPKDCVWDPELLTSERIPLTLMPPYLYKANRLFLNNFTHLQGMPRRYMITR